MINICVVSCSILTMVSLGLDSGVNVLVSMSVIVSILYLQTLLWMPLGKVTRFALPITPFILTVQLK